MDTHLFEAVMSVTCEEICKYPYMVEDESIMRETCENCKVQETVLAAMAAGLEKFQDDLTTFAEKNWAPGHIEMLKSAMHCVLLGKEVYAPIEEE